jgi:hypothetical protein
MKIYILLLFFLLNCVSIRNGKSELTVNYALESYNCTDQRGYHAKFLECRKEYYVKQLSARENFLKNNESDSKNQGILQKLEEIMEKKDFKRALAISASILKISTDEDLKKEVNEIALRAYQEIQLQEFNKNYPESKFALKEE